MDSDVKRLEFLLANMTDQADQAERTCRKMHSEIDSLRVEAARRNKLGLAVEIYVAGWCAGWEASLPESREVDWEVYQLDCERTQEVSDE